MVRRFLLPASLALLQVSATAAPAVFAPGELVRVSRGEMLQFEGKNFVGAAKGQEFPVIHEDLARGLVFVPFYKKDGAPVAVTIPADAVEEAPHDGWLDLLGSIEAFRDQRYDIMRPLLSRAAQDEKYKALVLALAPRLQGAIASRNAAALGVLRETAAQLEKLGYLSLALAVDQGTDRLGGTTAPATKLDRAALEPKVATSTRAVARTRQAIAMRCLMNATEEIDLGLQAEPNRPDLKAFQTKVQKDVEEAGQKYEDAERMRRFPKGTPHALTALEMGLKLCADYPKLLSLKKDMGEAFESQTAPPVDAAFMAVVKGGDAKELAEGHSLYTNRCTECHDLDLLDSRSMSSWERMVGNMSGRARIDSAQQARIVAYIAAAQKVVESKPQE
ncbi:hypothetical protein CfE428DRAFT_2083 [Chthoniobacter flavus Ellin428]|uniref:Cytochrome c domain-containing protein n=1 Tax=Chthoniobacter flavus Ellin428 TaxID=497964 RepID=B4CZJ5_9BACT|nr:hypothetical protein [Chthoniobacter flavus]EDY20159.1 hypothetical protein CfE428DRAFT_2083 [Chthoniobacter flavus Ellin428]TCO94057.1 hypothetical protein EV701_103144 [Chthoniobacter flavus]